MVLRYVLDATSSSTSPSISLQFYLLLSLFFSSLFTIVYDASVKRAMLTSQQLISHANAYIYSLLVIKSYPKHTLHPPFYPEDTLFAPAILSHPLDPS